MRKKIIIPTGKKITCKNWQIEGAYRMIQHNLSSDVAEVPEDLIVYGGNSTKSNPIASIPNFLNTNTS